MANQLIVDRIKDGIIDFNILAIYEDNDVDQIEHGIFTDYRDDPVMPSISINVRRLFPTYLEHKFPGAFSTEARMAMSGILFGLRIMEKLQVETDATKYMLAKDLESIRDTEDFYSIGYSCLGDIDFVPESIPRISLAESDEYDLELSAGFGLVISNCLETYHYQYDFTTS